MLRRGIQNAVKLEITTSMFCQLKTFIAVVVIAKILTKAERR